MANFSNRRIAEIATVLSCVCAGLFFCGCVPNATVYYRPSVDVESTHEESHCVPTEKYVHFNLKTKNTVLKIRGYGDSYTTSNGEFIEAQYVIYGTWTEIKFANDEFYAISNPSGTRIKPIKIYENIFKERTELMFNSGGVFAKPEGDNFDFIFPTLLIDGEEIKLPTLHIERKLWFGISPFNC